MNNEQMQYTANIILKFLDWCANNGIFLWGEDLEEDTTYEDILGRFLNEGGESNE